VEEKVYKTSINDLNELEQRLRTKWAKLDHVVITVGSYSSMPSLIALDLWCIFCTPTLAIFPTCRHQLD